jgi:hypothetical protein
VNKYAVKLVQQNMGDSSVAPMPVVASDDFHESDYLLLAKGVREIFIVFPPTNLNSSLGSGYSCSALFPVYGLRRYRFTPG